VPSFIPPFLNLSLTQTRYEARVILLNVILTLNGVKGKNLNRAGFPTAPFFYVIASEIVFLTVRPEPVEKPTSP